MHQHYDPLYLKSMQRNFSGFDRASSVYLADGSHASLAEVAKHLSR